MLYREPPEAIWADDVDRRVQFGIESGEFGDLVHRLPSLAPHPDSKGREGEQKLPKKSAAVCHNLVGHRSKKRWSREPEGQQLNFIL